MHKSAFKHEALQYMNSPLRREEEFRCLREETGGRKNGLKWLHEGKIKSPLAMRSVSACYSNLSFCPSITFFTVCPQDVFHFFTSDVVFSSEKRLFFVLDIFSELMQE